MINDSVIIEALQSASKKHGGMKPLAEDIGVSTQYLYDVINGGRPASERIADYLGYKGMWVRKK